MRTLRQLWDDYQRTAVVPGYETPHEIALQKFGFLCGACTAAAVLASEIELDLDADALLQEAAAGLRMEADRRAKVQDWYRLN